jgi:hypothetical protein
VPSTVSVDDTRFSTSPGAMIGPFFTIGRSTNAPTFDSSPRCGVSGSPIWIWCVTWTVLTPA